MSRAVQNNKKEVLVVPSLDTEGPTTGRDDLYDSWDKLHAAIKDMHERVRFAYPDAAGGPAVFSWFVLDWVGYNEYDPTFQKRGHTTGFHRIFDAYRETILSENALKQSGDGLYWHYHHPPKDGSWGWNRNWSDSNWYEKVLNKKILERHFFSSVFRAGGYVEDNKASAWLEQWIPFDYSNNSPAFKEGAYEWPRASRNWAPYHPAHNDYQSKGDMKRAIFRSVPVLGRVGSNVLTEKDVENAFLSAENGEKPVITFVTHDYYKNAAEELQTAHTLISRAARKHPNISWRYANALSAARESLSLSPLEGLTLSVTKIGANEFIIVSNHALFGLIPCVVISHHDTERRVDVEPTEANTWRLILEDEGVKKIGVAGSDAYGNTAVVIEHQ